MPPAEDIQPSNGQQHASQDDGPPLAPYLDTPIRLFMHDPVTLKSVAGVLPRIGFTNISAVRVDNNYFEAIRQLFSEVMSFDGILLVNHPPQRVGGTGGRLYIDPNFGDYYGGVQSLIQGTSADPAKLLRKCIPTFISPQDPDVRQSFLQDLMPFGILGAFMLKAPAPSAPVAVQIEDRTNELYYYFLEYFMHRDNKLENFREFRSAKDIKERKAKAKVIMTEVERLKAAKQFDKAIALCRKAIDVLPSDPEPYLEGGRMLVKKKKYSPAMQMFRDAEAVAKELPAPNEEIANMRVEQIRDHVTRCRAEGRPVDKSKLEGFLAEAVDNYRNALGKAETIKVLDKDSQKTERQNQLSGIVENMLTGGMIEAFGADHPQVRELMDMASSALDTKGLDEKRIPSVYRVQFGVMAFYQDKLPKAMHELLAAAADPETFDVACTKLNFIGTQLRRRGRIDEAIEVYSKVVELKPQFLCVVLFNQAVAHQTKVYNMRGQSGPEIEELERGSLGYAIEALYLSPDLTDDANFYHNTVMVPVLKKASELFRQAKEAGTKSQDPTSRACRLARDKLEGLLTSNKQGEAIAMLLDLAQRFKPFFLQFEQHASEVILDFTRRLHPILLKRSEPKMQTLGKILGVLVHMGSAPKAAAEVDDPMLKRIISLLKDGETASAAREMAYCLHARPDLCGCQALSTERELADLCWRIDGILSRIELERFAQAHQAETDPKLAKRG